MGCMARGRGASRPMSNPWEGFTDMTVRSTHLKLIGAAGAAALTVTAMAAPALAAGEESASVSYTCSTPFGDVHPSAVYTVDAPPAKIVAGQTAKLATTTQFTLDTAATGLAAGLGWTSFDGNITTDPANTHVGQNLKIARTDLNNNGDGTTTASSTGKTTVRYTKAGSFALKLASLGRVHLNGYNALGDPGTPASVDFPSADGSGTLGRCTNDATATNLKNGSAQNATVAVVKDKSKTATSAKYSAKKNVATGTAKVKGANFGLAGTGKVKFILKKGTHTVKTLKGKLNKKGVASVKFKHLAKAGKYSITAKFGGDKGLKASSGKDTFRVK
jgi:hypothetical protein